MRKTIQLTGLLTLICLTATLFSACSTSGTVPEQEEFSMTMTVTSTGFTEGGVIPAKYTCEDEDVSPEIHWSGAPDDTVSYALIVDDPDAPAGTYTHWLVFNIPSYTDGLPVAVSDETLADIGALQGKNSFENTGYGGPCPPHGSLHHYNFTVYAMDKTIDLPAGSTIERVLQAIEDSRIAAGRLTGTFHR